MAKCTFLILLFLFYRNTFFTQAFEVSTVSSSNTVENILPDGCKDLLLLFANDTAKFTHCVITNARPITVCKNCVHEYYQVLGRYENIQKLHHNDSEIDCRAVLTNIDRLQIVYASYSYVLNMWEQASCKLCLNGTVLNERTKHVIRLEKSLDNCISDHTNGTEPNSTLCVDCKEFYQNLISYYNMHKVNNEFCMDVVDLINITQSEWSLQLKCHVSNYNSEWILLVVSFTILLLPVIFYFINWLLSQERSNVLLSQNRWQERFTISAASTSRYVAIR